VAISYADGDCFATLARETAWMGTFLGRTGILPVIPMAGGKSAPASTPSN
jgi:hypothetical protein